MAVTSWTTNMLDQAEEATEVKGGSAIRGFSFISCFIVNTHSCVICRFTGTPYLSYNGALKKKTMKKKLATCRHVCKKV